MSEGQATFRYFVNAFLGAVWLASVLAMFLLSTKGQFYLETPYAIAAAAIGIGHGILLLSNAVCFLGKVK